MTFDTAFPQAVAEFLRRGGQIEALPPFECRPLPARREPARKAKPEPAQDVVVESEEERRRRAAATRWAASDSEKLAGLRRCIRLGRSKEQARRELKISAARLERLAAQHRLVFEPRGREANPLSDAQLAVQIEASAKAGRGKVETISSLKIGHERFCRICRNFGIAFNRNRNRSSR